MKRYSLEEWLIDFPRPNGGIRTSHAARKTIQKTGQQFAK